MGLSISRSIIEAHHGHVCATCNLGGGSTLSFTLPVGVARDEAPVLRQNGDAAAHREPRAV